MDPLHIHVPYPVLHEHVEFIRQHRYDLEIYFPASALDTIGQSDLEGLLERLDWNPSLTLHAPFMDLNPGADDPLVKSATEVRFRQLLDAAAILRPRVAVFHPAYYKWRYGGRTDVWLRNSVDTWKRVMDRASGLGLRVAVENVFDENPDAIRMLLEKIDHPDFGFCFDTGHCKLFSLVPMEQWFEALGSRLKEVHLHDNDGTADAHWALGKGTIDFDEFFRLMSRYAPRPVFTIEAHDKDDIDASKKRVQELITMHYAPAQD
jgi:sugar phosphate isomerase/epimerase